MSTYIVPKWPLPENVRAFTTTRLNGHSHQPYDSFNLGLHVGDTEKAVNLNRLDLHEELYLPNPCLWLQQNHSNKVIKATQWQENITADGCYSAHANQICTIMTADCLPILCCADNGQEVMALHGGWRGLAAGIIEQGLEHFKSSREKISVWLGPCISAESYEVGQDVYENIMSLNPAFNNAFKQGNPGHFYLDLLKLATLQLQFAGIKRIFCENRCTFIEKNTFFSYRREKQTGRMASLIYFKE